MVERWRQLPLDHALSCMPVVRALVDRLASSAHSDSQDAVPDLGPAVVMDQLTVLVFDASVQGRDATLADDLAALRRALA